MPTIYSEGYSAIWEMWVNSSLVVISRFSSGVVMLSHPLIETSVPKTVSAFQNPTFRTLSV